MRLRLLMMLITVRLRLTPSWTARRLRRHPARYSAAAFGLLLAGFIIVADFLPGPEPPVTGCTWQQAPQQIMVQVCSPVSNPAVTTGNHHDRAEHNRGIRRH